MEKVAHWLLNPDADEPNSLFDLLPFYLQIENAKNFVRQIDETASKNKDYRVLTQSVLLYPVMSNLRKQLVEKKLIDSYFNVEIPVLLIFGDMELTGFTIDKLCLKKSIKDWNSILTKLKVS